MFLKILSPQKTGSAVMQTTGFGFGTYIGTVAGGAATRAALSFAMLATPAGWFFVIGTGLAIGYAVAKTGDWLG